MRWTPLVALLAIAGCKKEPEPVEGPPEGTLVRVTSCDDLRDHLGDVMLETLLSQHYGLWWRWGVFEDVDTAAPGSDGPSDYTTTNVQEQGVDEIDLVKTDGEYLYVASDRELFIVDSWPAEQSSLVATLQLGGWARGLFLRGDVALVVYQPDQSELTGDRGWGATRLAVVDVSDRTAPQITRTLDVEGWLTDARLIDGDAYLVMNHWASWPDRLWELSQRPDLPELDWNLEGDAFDEARDEAMAEARVILEPLVDELAADLELDQVLPRVADSQTGSTELLHACTDLYHPAENTRYGVLSLVQLDLDDGTLGSAGVLSDGWTVYASQDNLYVAQSSWWSWWGWGDEEMESTIHRFTLDPDGEPTYTASGSVPGWIYDQFAMSEYDGYLRVATTDTDWWWGTAQGEEGANNVFVLEPQQLAKVGEVRGIAPGEQIQAVRMLGDKGYVVTFERVDPLFTLDLSDPIHPTIVGELELPGFSAYLHPYGDDQLLAVGMAGEEDGTLTGLAVNLFDVSDLANPQLVDQATLEGEGWGWSEALWDHHAFTFHRDVLSIPAYLDFHDPVSGEWDTFSGLVTFDVAPTGVEEGGRVDHRDLIADSECVYSYYWDYEPSVCYDAYWWASIRRSVYIEDNLFSISDYGVKVNDLNDPTVEVARVLFHPAP